MTRCNSLRLERVVEYEYCGYSGTNARWVTPSERAARNASSEYGFQLRIARYTGNAWPRLRSSSRKACACASLCARSGEPPPIDAYSRREYGARIVEISHAVGLMSARGTGILSGIRSTKKL